MSKQINQIQGLIFLFIVSFVLGLSSNAHVARAENKGTSPVIIILPFQVNAATDLQHLAMDFPEMLGKDLISRHVSVISSDRMLQVLQTSRVSTIDAATARNIANNAGATHAIFGTLNQVGNSMSVDARMVPAKGGTPKPYYIDHGTGGININSAVTSLGQNIATEFAPKDAVTAVEVRGTKILDPEVVLMRLSTRPGDKVDSTIIDSDMKRIWDLGYFNDVQVGLEPRPEGMALVYTVVEKPRIESIEVEGASEVSADDITSAMSTKQGSIYNETVLAEDLQKITELYRKKGYYLASVSPRVDMRADGASAALIIAVDEGQKQYIKEVVLEGVSQMSESSVKSEMLLKPRGWLSWITGTGVLREELIERDATAITSYYLNNGFLDITVGAARVDYQEDGIIVTFPIMEGERYKLGDINFAGDLIQKEEELFEVIKMDELAKKGEYFNLETMQEDEKNLLAVYAYHGYGYAEVNPTPQKRTDQSNIVDIIYHIDKKHKLYIGRVLVEGNNKTRNNVILREMALTDGEAFDGEKLKYSNYRLNRLGYFELSEIELVPTAIEDEVDLKVKVKEKPTGALMAGVGYSTFSNVGVTGTLIERNLFGKGYIASFQAGFNSRRNAYQFSFTNPRLYDTDLSVGIDLYHWRDDYIDYRKRTTGGTLRFSYPIGKYTSVGWGYRFDKYKIYDLEDDASDILRRYDTGDRYSSVGMLRLNRDSTDHFYPTEGNIDRIQVDYGGGVLGGDDDFVTVTLEHQTYYELWKNHVLRGRVKAAAIYKNGSKEVPVFERFWMGGIDSVRGYNSRDIVPRDKKSGDRIGGTRMAFANLEYIWTFSEELGMSLVPFFDIGINADDDHSWNWSDEVKKSVGAELRWRSPMGDLRFAYGIPLDDDRKGNRNSGRFEFSMGQVF